MNKLNCKYSFVSSFTKCLMNDYLAIVALSFVSFVSFVFLVGALSFEISSDLATSFDGSSFVDSSPCTVLFSTFPSSTMSFCSSSFVLLVVFCFFCFFFGGFIS
eukprot:296449_1